MRLSAAIEHYLRAKRANGLSYETEAGILFSFRRHADDPLIEEITTKEVADFLDIRRCSNGRWMTKHGCLRLFFEFWTDRGHISAIAMPQPKRTETDRVAPPCIYTRTELRRLIHSIDANHSHGSCAVAARTFRTVLLTLYGTGARTGEIFRLKRDDLDLKCNFVFLHGDRKILPRRIPLNGALKEELSRYLRSAERRSTPPSPNVFVSKRGKPLQAASMFASFARLRARACVVRLDAGTRRPRMGDLRQTFAVHRIAAWINEGADFNRMLPALSAYMGLSDLCSIERFLRMTPERFKRELEELSSYRARKHWRDDLEVMRFLNSLDTATSRPTGNN
jgi:integrase/recombinase XerD